MDVYNASAATLNLVRAFTTGGYADLRQVHTWNTDFVRDSVVGQRYEKVANEIDRAMAFMEAIGADPDEFHRVDFHSSHEALVLEYEHAMTRIDSRTEQPYDVSGHFVWIGERTRQLDGAHVELLSRIRNPIGVKLGPTTTADDALALAAKLNPANEPGRLTFITRFGAQQDPRRAARPGREGDRLRHRGRLGVRPDARQHVRGQLRLQDPALRRRDRGGAGLLRRAPALGTWPGGIHVELTGDDVTECVGGGQELAEVDLAHRYESVCDPRLNRVQSLELAFLVAEMLRRA